MFRPPPTLIEIGTENDFKQFQELDRLRYGSETPPSKQPQVFVSPEINSKRSIISTPSGLIDSPE